MFYCSRSIDFPLLLVHSKTREQLNIVIHTKTTFRVMSKPFEKKDEDNDANHDVQAPDGGWGWIVVVG